VKQSEQHIRKLVELGRLAGSVAHDFNNLLTAILGSTELLLEMLPADHPGREEAEEVRKAALRAADLTRKLLDALDAPSDS
jgi:signal transduction histidine kinase